MPSLHFCAIIRIHDSLTDMAGTLRLCYKAMEKWVLPRIAAALARTSSRFSRPYMYMSFRTTDLGLLEVMAGQEATADNRAEASVPHAP